MSRAVLALLVSSYGWLVLSHASRFVGGSDSSGYFNAAKDISTGRLVQRIDALDRLGIPADRSHLLIPLGYVPGPKPGTMATFYPIGLPLHEIGLASLFGWSLGPFLVSPIAAIAALLLMHAVARELGLSRPGALACTAILAVLPVLTFQAVQLMSDALAASWALATILFALRSRRRVSWAVPAGLAFGIGVLIRPTSAALIVPILFAMAPSKRAWALFLSGGAPAGAAFLAFNRVAYGGALRTGYGTGGALADFSWSNFAPRFLHYTYWISAMVSPLLPVAWLLLAADRRRALRVRLLRLSWFGAFFLIYCFYGPYETWWYTRYLLPGIPALVIATGMVAEDLIDRARRHGSRAGRRFASAAVVVAFAAACFCGLRLGRRFDVLQVARGQSVFRETIRWASSRVPERSVVLAMEFSGAMHAYRWGRFVRWDWIDVGQFASLRAQMDASGYRVFALMLPHEVREAAWRLPGKWKYLGSNRDASLWELEVSR